MLISTGCTKESGLAIAEIIPVHESGPKHQGNNYHTQVIHDLKAQDIVTVNIDPSAPRSDSVWFMHYGGLPLTHARNYIHGKACVRVITLYTMIQIQGCRSEV